ncbi:hypothetical protein [Actinomadura algeriensis]|uniref:Cytochrome c oxidase assembly protein n=1 Tax=Actinomadura algeriensis TaxID=1679523 RepID=A0ABR9JIL2_9ACTN|nr:hypothetical protein [Actinomadura algeriensis]MBE1530268.1 hypothetical protein [Actinomadura algeriensis]
MTAQLRRPLHIAFAAYCLVAALAVQSVPDPKYPLMQTVATAGYLVAAALLNVLALARARRALIGFHLAFLPVQFVFLFGGSQAPMAGMLFGALTVAMMRPRFPRLRRTSRRVWLTLHVGVSVGWLGLAVAMATLAVAGATAEQHAVRHGAYVLMHVFDLAIVIPSVALAIITGLVVSLGTKWGLVRHWWVLLKFVISLVIPVIATVQSGWIERLEHRTADPAGDPGDLGLVLVGCMLVYTALLWTAVVLSVVKPGGRTPWARNRPRPDRPDVAAAAGGAAGGGESAATRGAGRQGSPPAGPGTAEAPRVS